MLLAQLAILGACDAYDRRLCLRNDQSHRGFSLQNEPLERLSPDP